MPLTPSTPRIHYVEEGSSGQPVLFVMGFGLTGEAWAPQVEDLSADHRCIVFDNRGVGRSEGSAAGWSVQDMADDSLRVLEARGWERAHLVGVSMGGMIARELARAEPHRWASLTLIASHAGGWRNMMPSPRALADFSRAQVSSTEVRVAALERLLFPDEWLAQIDRDDLFRRLRGRAGRGGRARRSIAASQFQAVVRYGRRAESGALSMPTLIIKPARDVLVPPHNSDLLAERIHGSRLVTLEEAGHGATLSHAELVNAALRDHFAANPA